MATTAPDPRLPVPAVEAFSFERALLALRASNPGRELSAGGVSMKYLAWGSGSETLLVLPGVSGGPEMASLLVSSLPPGFRLLAPDHPRVTTMAELVSLLVALLDREGVARAHVLGKSYGGLVAQCLVRAHPERVASLALFLTAPPDPAREPTLRRNQQALRLLPAWLIRLVSRLALAPLLSQIRSERAFWTAYLRKQAALFDREEALALMDRTLDFDLHYRFTDGDLRGWPGRVLVMDSDDDPVVPPPARAALRRLYPEARTHTFVGTQHSASVLAPAEFAEVLGSFLREVRQEPGPTC